MKALRNGYIKEAEAMINLGADLKQADNEGINPMDFIISNRIKSLLEIINLLQCENQGTAVGQKECRRVAENLQKMAGDGPISLNVAENDRLEHNTTKSENSEKQQKDVCKAGDLQLLNDIKLLKDSVGVSSANLEQLKERNCALKRKLQAKRKRESVCLIQQASSSEPMQSMIDQLTKETEHYLGWIAKYRRISKPFFMNIYSLIKSHVGSFYGDNAKLTVSGSYQNGLIMSWSDLNLIVTFPYDQRNESKRRSSIIDSVKKFSKVLKADKTAVKSYELEERSSLLILKLELTKQYRNQDVEIIFKYYVNPSYPSNEEIIDEYLAHYPLAKPLYILFRSILHRSRLDDPSFNGLKSVAIFLMVVAYLQHTTDQNVSMGQLLINFLFFYTYSFDLYRDCVNPYPIKSKPHNPFSVKDSRKRIHSLMVINPYNDDIILTKSFKRSCELKQLMKMMYISLFNRCHCPVERNFTISPKRQPNGSMKTAVDDKDTEVFEDPLDRFKSIIVRYLGKVAKRGPKLSLCLDLEEPRLMGRGSFSFIRTTMEDLYEDELLAPKKDHFIRPPRFLLHALLSYNYTPNLTYNPQPFI